MNLTNMQIRLATEQDWPQIWAFFQPIAQAGETYAYEASINSEQAKLLWFSQPLKTYVVEQQGQILASYYLKTNQAGPGKHVCNCGYMVAAQASGQGLATAMCKHSQQVAIDLGFKAMQFNFVAKSNEHAVRLWLKLGYQIVGTLPKAFNHQSLGFVDALVMYKWLASSS
ncbi:N-acetyltransferase family protein [Paraglaciecola aestuariivivens]